MKPWERNYTSGKPWELDFEAVPADSAVVSEWAEDHPLAEAAVREKGERTPSETFMGIMESMATMGTSPLAVPATVIGAVDGFVGSVRAGHEFGSKEFNDNMRARQEQVVSQAMYQPRTEAGQEYMEAVGETIGPLEALEPLMPAMAGMMPNVARAARADAANAGLTRNLDGPTQTEKEVGRRVEAARTGGQSLPAGERLSVGAAYAGDVAPGIALDQPALTVANRFVDDATARMYRDASPETRQEMINMLNVAQSVADKPGVFKMPREVIGDSIAARATMLANVRQRYAGRIKDVVSEMGDQSVDTSVLRDSFDDILSKYKIKRNDDGSFDVNGSRIADKEANAVLKTIYERMDGRLEDGATFEQLHVDKQWLQDMANYNPGMTGGSAQLNSAIKEMAGAVNDTLRVDSDGKLNDYAKANDAFASTVRPFEALAKLTGDKSINFDDPKQVSELARKSRGLTNNTKQGVDLNYAMEDVEKLIGEAVERGMLTPEEIAALAFDPKEMRFKSDINEMAHFASSIDALYPNMRPTSMSGILDQSSQSTVDGLLNMGADAMVNNKLGMGRNMKNIVEDLMSTQEGRVRKAEARRSERQVIEDTLRDEVVASLFDILER